MPALSDIPAAETAIVRMTNAFRVENGLSPVRRNTQLEAAARRYAEKLASYRGLSHTADGTTPAQRITASGYSYCEVGENLASLLDTRGFTPDEFAKRAVTGWENSPGHRKNMLSPHVTETGVAIARAAPNEPKYIAVQLFARPEAAKYRFKVVNEAARVVSYSFNGEDNTVSPREIITHTACVPGILAFGSATKPRAAGRYETRDGQVFTLKPSDDGGIRVEMGSKAPR